MFLISEVGNVVQLLDCVSTHTRVPDLVYVQLHTHTPYGIKRTRPFNSWYNARTNLGLARIGRELESSMEILGWLNSGPSRDVQGCKITGATSVILHRDVSPNLGIQPRVG